MEIYRQGRSIPVESCLKREAERDGTILKTMCRGSPVGWGRGAASPDGANTEPLPSGAIRTEENTFPESGHANQGLAPHSQEDSRKAPLPFLRTCVSGYS